MKYMLLIHQGDTPQPGSPEWERLSAEEQQAVYRDYQAINVDRESIKTTDLQAFSHLYLDPSGVTASQVVQASRGSGPKRKNTPAASLALTDHL